MTIELGRLQPVRAREVWPHEALDFTPWLLQNVDVLSDLLGMDLVLEAAEHPVGDFSLDLIGRDESTGERVIVENQLEVSDHTHLGQIITYAAGTDPTTIVWVTTGFRPEHRAAIDWLNERTDENTRVFGVVIHVVKIGDSQVAPNFELVAQPNDWEKTVRRVAREQSEPSEQALINMEFWERFLSAARERNMPWAPRGATTRGTWIDTVTGIQGQVVTFTFTKHGLQAQLYWGSPDADLNTARYEALAAHRAEFEAALGEPAVWDPMEARKAARVIVQSPYMSINQRDQWPAINDWIIDQRQKIIAALEAAGGNALIENATGGPSHGG